MSNHDSSVESWPLFNAGEDVAALPKTIRNHPVVGFGRGGDPACARQRGTYSRGIAFVWVAGLREVEWRASAANPYYLALRPGAVIREDPSVIWGWTPQFTRRFIRDVCESGLFDRPLAECLLKCTGGTMAGAWRVSIPRRDRDAVLRKTSGRCAYCAVTLTVVPGQPHSYCVDHVLPVARGGSNDIANLIPSCRSCNTKKS